MHNIHNSQSDVVIEKATLGNLSNGICLEPHFRAIEMLFTKQINAKQEAVNDRLERGQAEIGVLNALLGAVQAGTNDQGLKVTDKMQQQLAQFAKLDPLSLAQPFVNPNLIDAQLEDPNLTADERKNLLAEKKLAIARLETEASAVQTINDVSLGFTVKLAVGDANVQSLIEDLGKPEYADHPLRKLFADIEFDGSVDATPEQLQAIASAANQTDYIKPNETLDDAEKTVRLEKQFANRGVRELLQKHNLLDQKADFKKPDAEQIAKNIKGLMKQKEAFNGLDQKKASTLENQINKMYEALITCAKKWSEAIEKMARGIKG